MGKRLFVRALAVFLGSTLLIGVPTVGASAQSSPVVVQAQPAAAFDVTPARDLLGRLFGRSADGIELATIPANGTAETFSVRVGSSGPLVEGSSLSALLQGVNHYLKYTALVDVSWSAYPSQLPITLPATLPLPTASVTRTAAVPVRFLGNDTADGYTNAYWDWERWQQEIDVDALHGINRLFMPVGAEAVYYQVFQRFGYSATELKAWIPAPAHQPWWLLQNMWNFDKPVSADMIDQRAQVGRKIADRMRELGIEPVLPGYSGTVPQGFVGKNSGTDAVVVPQGGWSGLTRPDWLDPRTQAFRTVAADFYATQETLFGKSSWFKMDFLHEGGNAGNIKVGEASVALQNALDTAHPGAIWAILGWQSNPKKEMLDSAVDLTRVFVVDGLSDSDHGAGVNPEKTSVARLEAWNRVPMAYGSIWNYGGHTTFGGSQRLWNTKFFSLKANPKINIQGIALMPEGNNNNDFNFEFLTELAWESGPVDVDDWTADFAAARYGAADASAAAAWTTMLNTAYALVHDGYGPEGAESLYTAQPSLTVDKAGCCSPGTQIYDPFEFSGAFMDLLAADKKLQDNALYRFDLADVARQTLANTARLWLPKIKAAYDAKDLARFDELTTRWLAAMDLLEKVTGTQREFLLGDFLSYGVDGAAEADKVTVRNDLQLILTSWHRLPGLQDYADHEWNGLLSTYYKPRWSEYFQTLRTALTTSRSPVSVNWLQRATTWADQAHDVAIDPVGDQVEIAGQIRDFLGDLPNAVSLSLGLVNSGPDLALGRTAELNVTVKNNSLIPVTVTSPVVSGPDVVVEGVSGTNLALAAGESKVVSVRITPTLTAPGPVTLAAAATVSGGGSDSAESSATTTFQVKKVALSSSAYLSDLPFAEAVSGVGAVMRDVPASGSGGTVLKLKGVTYPKGVGLNSQGLLSVDLGSQCSRLTMIVGIDDVMDKPSASGNVVVRILGDGVELARSGELKNAPAAGGAKDLWNVDLDITGVDRLSIAVDANGVDYWDVTDLADAKVACAPAPIISKGYLSDLTFAEDVSGVGSVVRDKPASGSGGTVLKLKGVTYPKGVGLNSQGLLSVDLGSQCSRLTMIVGIDDVMDKPSASGNVVVRILGDGVELAKSGELKNAPAAGGAKDLWNVNVDITGVDRLSIVVDANGSNYFDVTDLADAKVACAPVTTATVDPSEPDGSAGWYRTSPSVTLQPAGGVGVSVSHSQVGGTHQVYTAPYLIPEGKADSHFWSVDAAGNTETRQLLRLKVDTTAPVSLARTGGENPVVVSVSATDSTSGIASTQYRLPGGDWVPYSEPFTIDRADTAQTVRFRSTDVAGNVEEPQSVVIDPIDNPVGFTDVPVGSRFFTEISWAAASGVTTGFPDGTFRPGAPVERQAMAAFLYRLANGSGPAPACTSKPYPDVPVGSPFCGQISWLKSQHIATGWADGTFRPVAAIERQAMAAFLFRAKNPGAQPADCTAKPFTDVSKSADFCGAVNWLKDSGATTGFPDGSFHPGASIERQAMAAFLYRLRN